MRRKPHDKFFDRRLRGWMVNYARRNYWRVAGYYDLDDLIQDGMVEFLLCKERYADRVENQAHFMALYKLMFHSHITNLANTRKRIDDAGLREIPIGDISIDVDLDGIEGDARDQLVMELIGGSVGPDAEMMCILQKAPEQIKTLLSKLQAGELQESRVVKQIRSPTGKFLSGARRETNNSFLNRVLGTDGYDYEASFRELLA